MAFLQVAIGAVVPDEAPADRDAVPCAVKLGHVKLKSWDSEDTVIGMLISHGTRAQAGSTLTK